MSEVPVVRDPPPEADRPKPAVLVAVALASMLVGFLVVYLPGRGGAPAPREHEPAAAPAKRGSAEAPERETPVLAVAPRPVENVAAVPLPQTAAEATPEPATAEARAPEPTTATAEEPATPASAATPGVPLRARVGDLYYWRCWDEGRDDPLPQEHCERLRAMEPIVADQLDTVASCARERGAGAGKLSLGLELNFATNSIRYWGGRSSTIANAADVAGCVRSRWRVDMAAIHHAHSRYTIFVPIDLEPR